MNIELIVGMILILMVISLAVWHFLLSKQEDDSMHLVHGASAIPQQATLVHREEVIGKWGKILTIIMVAYWIIVGAIYLYRYWIHASGSGI